MNGGDMTSVTIGVPAMYADHHVVEVRRILHDVPGVRAVYASSAFGVVEIEFDAEHTSAAALERRLDEEGYLTITGRIKDILLCNGRKVSASEVEWLACVDAADLNPLAAAAFMPDQTANGLAVLIIETRLGQGISKDADSLRRAIRQKILGEWGIDLTDILFVPRGRLDRTSSGKIRRQAVAQAYRAGAFAAQGKAEAS